MAEKIVCVTGASSGIGAEICVQLANEGATVIGLARRVEKIEELNDKLKSESGKIIGIKCDMENQSEILSAFEKIKNDYGHLDVFINNAGIMLTNLITDDDPEHFRKLFEVNVVASCLCIKETVKLMKEQGSGHIIVMNSILGHRIPDIPPTLKPPFGLYPATKFALTALCQTLRAEMSYLKLAIKITSISPGMIETELLTNLNPHLVAIMPKLKVEDVADAVKYALNTPKRVRVDEIILNPMS